MSPKPGNDGIVVVSNRLPVGGGAGKWRVSAGGLVTALRPLMDRQPGRWIGWNGGASDMPKRVPGIEADLVPVELTRSDIQGYYHGFSNRTIWPLFHDLVRPARFDDGWWKTYQEVNEAFCAATSSTLKRGSTPGLVWVHDYHLMLVPALLREKNVKVPISFFLHIPWPPPELFARIPWRREILRGVLGADVVSFHTDLYRKNFVRTCGRLLPEVTVRGRSVIVDDGREVQTTAHPISIDAREFAELARSDEVDGILQRLKRQFDDRKILLGVDRLDYTKGILERLGAFETLLERRSDLRRKLTMIQIAVPSRASVSEYREMRAQIDQIVGRINGRFTEPGYDVPLHYIHREMPRPRLLAYYLLADLMLVTPLKDGMNLVAKEYVVAQGAVGGSGALLLSEFTGAALELTEALPCNPFDVEGLSRRYEEALEFDAKDLRSRMSSMFRRVKTNDVHRWLDRQLQDLER